MKKFSILVVIFIIMSLFAVSYADEINATSGDSAPEYIDSTSELDALYGQEQDEDPLKQAYDMYQQYMNEYYDVYERPEVFKARVLEAGEPEEQYFQQDYYSVSKYVVQSVKVEVLEGDYIGTVQEIDYVLTMDSLNNINIAKANVGDVIFVAIEKNESGDATLMVSNSWSAVSRFNVVIVLAIIAAILLLIYVGRKGLGVILTIAITIAGIVVGVCAFAYHQFSVVWLSVLLMVLISLVISIIHLGFNKNMFKAFLISIGMILITWFILFVSCNSARSVGVSFEFAAIAENIVQKRINFEQLYYIISLFMATIVISNTVAMAANRMLRENVSSFIERVGVSKKALASNITILAVVIFALYIPNHILLLSNKFLFREIINSETFVSELIRFFVITITTTIAVPVASLNIFGFGKKFISAPEIKEINNIGTKKQEEVSKVVVEEKEPKEVIEEGVQEEIKEVVNPEENVIQEEIKEVTKPEEVVKEEVKETSKKGKKSKSKK